MTQTTTRTVFEYRGCKVVVSYTDIRKWEYSVNKGDTPIEPISDTYWLRNKEQAIVAAKMDIDNAIATAISRLERDLTALKTLQSQQIYAEVINKGLIVDQVNHLDF